MLVSALCLCLLPQGPILNLPAVLGDATPLQHSELIDRLGKAERCGSKNWSSSTLSARSTRTVLCPCSRCFLFVGIDSCAVKVTCSLLACRASLLRFADKNVFHASHAEPLSTGTVPGMAYLTNWSMRCVTESTAIRGIETNRPWTATDRRTILISVRNRWRFMRQPLGRFNRDLPVVAVANLHTGG